MPCSPHSLLRWLAAEQHFIGLQHLGERQSPCWFAGPGVQCSWRQLRWLSGTFGRSPLRLLHQCDWRYNVLVATQPTEDCRGMQTVKYVSWEEDGAWLGFLQDFPDYWTQGETLDDLRDHLRDLYHDLTSEELPGIRKVDE